MKNIFILLFFLFAWSGIQAQAIVKGSGVLYTNGAPTNPVNISVDAEICIDTAAGLWYEYNRDTGSWAKAGFRVQRKNISIAPTGAPGDKQSEVIINDVDSMYLWRSGAWRHLNKVGDASITNEGILGVGAGSGTSSTLISNTSTSNAVTINAGSGLSISETTSSNGGQITIEADDISAGNEIQTLSAGDGSGSNKTLNLSITGDEITLRPGTGIGLARSGDTLTFSTPLVGLPSGTDGQTLRNSSGTWISNSFLLNNGTQVGVGRTPSKVLDVEGQIRAIGSGLLFSNSTSPTLLLENSSTNGNQWYMHSDNDGYLNVSESALGGSGINFWRIEPVNGNSSFGDAGFAQKVNIEGTARLLDLTSNVPTRIVGADADGDLGQLIIGTGLTLSGDTIKSTGGGGGDPSITNEGILGVGAGSGTSSTLISNTSTSNAVTINAAGILAITESTSSNGGSITLTATEVDGSLTNEGSLTVGAGTGSTSVINSNTSGSTGVTLTAGTGLGISESGNVITLTNSSPDQTVALTGAGITAVTGTYPNFTITSTEVDGSVTNELQTINNTSDGTSHTVTLSNTGGSVQLVEGANVTLTTTGTGSDGIVTVAVPSSILPTVTATDVLIGTGSPGYQGAVFAQFTSAGMDLSGGKPYNLISSGGARMSVTTNGSDSTMRFTSDDVGSRFGAYTRGKNLLYYRQYSFFGGNENNVSGFNSEINGVNVITPGSTLTGVVSGAVSEATRKITLINESASNSLIISNENAASIAANRFSIGSDYTLAAGKMISFIYDKNASRWVFYKPQGDIAPDQTVVLTGGGITNITGTYPNFTITSTEVDGSLTNEGSLTVGAGTGSTSVINSNTSGSTGVTLTAGTGLGISESGNVITLTNSSPDQTVALTGAGITAVTGTYPNFTLTSTEVDGSVTNELQTINNTSDATSHTVTLSNTGGSVQLVEGSNISLTTTGTGADGIITIASTGSGDPSITNEGDLTVGAGTGSTSIINSNTSGSTGVTITAGTGLGISESGNVITLTNSSPDQTVALTGAGITAVTGTYPSFTLTSTEVDGSVSNEGILGVGAGSGTSATLISNTSTSNAVTINAAGILAISESTSSNGGSITLTATEVDGSTTNELQTVNNTSNATSHTVTLSNTGGSIQLVEGTNITLTTTGTGSDGIVTIAATGGGGSPVVITPSQITVTQNNYSPTDWATATVVFLSNDGVDIWGITGFSSSGLSSGHTKRLVNTSKTQLYIAPNHPNSSSANRITGDRDFILGYGKSVDIVFNGSTWFLLGESADATVSYKWSPGSVTSGDWGDVTFTAINSGTITNIASPDATNPISQLATTAATTTGGGSIAISKTNTKIARINTGHLYMESSLKTPSSLSDATNSYTCGIGFGAITATSSLTANSCITIQYTHSLSGGNWTLSTVNSAGTTTDVDLGVAVAASTRYNLRIEVSDDGLEVRAFVNGEMKGISTTNMPSTTAEFLAKTQILKSAGSSDRQLSIFSLETGVHIKY